MKSIQSVIKCYNISQGDRFQNIPGAINLCEVKFNFPGSFGISRIFILKKNLTLTFNFDFNLAYHVHYSFIWSKRLNSRGISKFAIMYHQIRCRDEGHHIKMYYVLNPVEVFFFIYGPIYYNDSNFACLGNRGLNLLLV